MEPSNLPDYPSWEDIEAVLKYLAEGLGIPTWILEFLRGYLKIGFDNAEKVSFLSEVNASPEDQNAHRILFHKTPFLRRQPLNEVTYICKECGCERTTWVIPSPFKASYCVNADGTETVCQRTARLRRQREYNQRRKQKKVQE